MNRLLVGQEAPDFTVDAVCQGSKVQKVSLRDYRGSYVILFFYPLDFTFVCPTELHAFQDALEQFTQRNTTVLGCSVDSAYSHLAWLNTPKSKGGIEGVTYPVLSDLNKTVSQDYGVLIQDSGIAYRGLFLIDKGGIVRHQVVNDLPLGRSVNETLRMVDALKCFEDHGEVCPANWQKGKEAMKPNSSGLEEYFSSKV